MPNSCGKGGERVLTFCVGVIWQIWVQIYEILLVRRTGKILGVEDNFFISSTFRATESYAEFN